MKTRISVINKSTGKFTTETINSRKHVVTSMMAIEGDSVMNALFYPNKVVSNAMGQLDMLPAPDGHPDHDGKAISAFNPLAINAHNFGGFIRSPRLDGKRVITDLVIDIEVANKSERGKKIIERIKSGKRIGVSTGLLADVSNAAGKVGDQEFDGQVDYIEFDHVAVLLDATPAGENTYTINHGEYKPKERGMFMDKLELDLTSLAIEDRLLVGNLKVNELLAHVKHVITVPEAKAICTNAGLEFYSTPKGEMDTYLANKTAFEAFIETASGKRDETIAFIVKNSKMSKEQIENMDDESLESLANTVAPKNNYRANNGKPVGEKPELELINLDELQNSLKQA